MWERSGVQASSVASSIDQVSAYVTLVAVLFSVGIALAIIYFAVKYRQGNRVNRARAPQYNHVIEATWIGIPLLIALSIYVWATRVYFHTVRVPPGAMEIFVVGKQWMWKMQHPNGRWENNELHIPIGQPIVLTMTSEDVVHAFYVPAFRLKWDVYPGQYTQMWFTPTRPGTYRLYCAEYCGLLHSGMVGTVVAMEPAAYERWLREGTEPGTAAAIGEQLFRRHGCSGCHSPNSSVRAPLLQGLYGRTRPVQIPRAGVPLEQAEPTMITADAAYIHDSILLPEKHIAAGYQPIMPSYQNQLSEEEIFQLVSYIRTLQGPVVEGARDGGQRRLSPEEYRARTGFVPERMPTGAGAAAGRGEAGVVSPPTGAGLGARTQVGPPPAGEAVPGPGAGSRAPVHQRRPERQGPAGETAPGPGAGSRAPVHERRLR